MEDAKTCKGSFNFEGNKTMTTSPSLREAIEQINKDGFAGISFDLFPAVKTIFHGASLENMLMRLKKEWHKEWKKK